MKRSKELERKASKFMPTGAADSIFIENAKGSHIWDVDGNEYIDYKLGWGPVILGHSHPAVQKNVHEYDSKGICYALGNMLEIEVAKKIKSLVPSAEMIRFFVSGTEATMHAIRIARAYTKREKIVKFEGHYHGTHDYALFSVESKSNISPGKPEPNCLGIPDTLKKLVIVDQWNDFDSVEKIVKKEATNIAAIITEPIMANNSVIPPREEYLPFLKELCEKNDIVLIFDEVKTGFRVSQGGAQQLFGVKPHLTTFAKALGNGYPISAVVGLEEIMRKYATNDVILYQSTYARNPVSLAAAEATLDKIKKGDVHPNIKKVGDALMKGIREILKDERMYDVIVQGYPSMFQLLFTKQDRVYNYRDFITCNTDLFKKLQGRLLENGILIDEYNSEAWYMSDSHNLSDVEQTLEAFQASLPLLPASSSGKPRKRVNPLLRENKIHI
jgi:glutamate-1-semialdehyde 2,1-aminomutase